MGEFDKTMQKALQNQADRVRKQQELQQTDLPNKRTVIARQPDMPQNGVKVACQYCNREITRDVNTEGLDPKAAASAIRIKDIELRYRCCSTCRESIVGPGGVVDRGTQGVVSERKL